MTSTKEFTKVMSDFTQYKASQKLKQLAKNPYDLTQDQSLNPQRIARFSAEACGYKMLYATERVDEDTMKSLVDLAQEAQALKKMEKLQAGETMNFIHGYPSDNRPVLHTAARDFFENPNKGKAAADAAKQTRQQADKLKAFMDKIDLENRFQELIFIGIGGSDLGPKAHYLALLHLQKPGRKIHFISNIDPDNVSHVLKKANLSKTLVVINSKSGTTMETATNDEFVRSQFTKAGLKPEEHFISVSVKGSPLDNPKKYKECFYIWDWIGGRFSTSSMAGGFLLAFAFGFDVYWEFLRGANAMDKAALNTDINKNLPLLGALIGIWNRNFLNYPNLAIVPYSQPLGRFAAHLQQLDMESNGKHIDQKGERVDFETGPIIIGEPGTAAQHSFFQHLHQGTTIVPIEFIGFKQNQDGLDISINGTTQQEKLLGNLIAQAIAMATGKRSDNPNKVFEGNRPSHILLSRQLTPYSLGVLLAYYEHKIAFQGFIWGINTFDQEGVQLGKELANRVIGRIAANHGSPNGDSSPYPVGDAYLKIMDSL